MQPLGLYFLRLFRENVVHSLIVERRSMPSNRSLAQDLAVQLAEVSRLGKAVVVSDKPDVLLPVVRKQWLRLERKIWLERARTINSARITELSNELSLMRNVSFTASPPDDLLEADITFATVDDFIRVAPDCKKMFVTYDFPVVKLHMITGWMPRSGVVVIYDKK